MQVVEAWPVHGCCGIWGTLAVGLVHPTEGLFTTGNGALFRSQVIGVAAIGGMTFLLVTPVAYMLNRAGVLRVKLEEEARGLDYKFGNAASAYIMQKNQRIRASFLTLDAYGCTIEDVLSALKSLKMTIILNFNPQACGHPTPSPCPHPLRAPRRGHTITSAHLSTTLLYRSSPLLQGSDNIIDAEVADLLSRCEIPEVERHHALKYFAFVSHHKADAGDAARILVDAARRLIHEGELDKNRHLQSVHKNLNRQGSYANRRTGGGFASPEMHRGSSGEDEAADRQPSEHDAEATEEGSGASGGKPPCMTEIFLDSNDLSQLKSLTECVKESANHVLLLSRATLERPYVLCELVVAHKQKKNIHVVKCDWPGDTGDSPYSKSFQFPRHLNEAIEEWEEVAYFQKQRVETPDTVGGSAKGPGLSAAGCAATMKNMVASFIECMRFSHLQAVSSKMYAETTSKLRRMSQTIQKLSNGDLTESINEFHQLQDKTEDENGDPMVPGVDTSATDEGADDSVPSSRGGETPKENPKGGRGLLGRKGNGSKGSPPQSGNRDKPVRGRSNTPMGTPTGDAALSS